jgi:arylamine N-acetyltransferase
MLPIASMKRQHIAILAKREVHLDFLADSPFPIQGVRLTSGGNLQTTHRPFPKTENAVPHQA